MRRPNEMPRERSLSELVVDLTDQVRTLFRQEVALARVEVQQNARQTARSLAMFAVGAVLAWAGFLAFTAAAVLGLSAAGLSGWAAAIVVGAVLALAGALAVWVGLSRWRGIQWTPVATVNTLRDSAEALKGAGR